MGGNTLKVRCGLAFRENALIRVTAFLASVVATAGLLTAVPVGRANAVSSSPYAAAVLQDSPSAYLRLDDASTTAADKSGHGHAGTIAADAVHQATGALPADPDGSLQSGPTTPDLTVPAAGLPGVSSSQTVELWVLGKPSDAAGCGSSSYVSWNGLVLAVDSGCGSGGLQLRDNGTVVASTGNELPVLADGSWHQIGYSYDNTSHAVVLYLDGVAVGTASGVALAGSGAPFLTTFNGGIDEVAIYPAALPAARIAAHFTAGMATGPGCAAAVTSPYGKSVLADSPLRYFPLDEADGARVALDASGNCGNGARADDAPSAPGALVTSDSALKGDAAGRGLSASTAGLPGASTPQTVELWVQGKPSDAAGCGSSSYVSWNGLVLAVDSGCGSGGLQLRDTAGVVASTGNELPVLTDGSWHQIGYTYDPAAHTVVLYLDGVAITTVTGAVLHEATTPFLTTFNGGIDEAAIYPAVLPADRIAAHYTAGMATGPGARRR